MFTMAITTSRSKTKKKKKRKKKKEKKEKTNYTMSLRPRRYEEMFYKHFAKNSGIIRGLQNPKSWTLEEAT